MIKVWIRGLNDRERLLLAGSALLSLATLLYLLAWRPMVAERSRLQEQVDRKQALVVWVSAASEEVKRLQPSSTPSASSDKPLEQLLADQASHLQLRAKRVTRGAAGEVTLALESAEFKQLLQLLELSNREGVQLLKADLHGTTSPGRVGAQLTFSK